MTGGEVALIVGAGVVGLVIVYKAGKASTTVPTTLPAANGVGGAAPGSTIGTGTSARATVGAKVLTGSSSVSGKSAAEGLLATAVLGPSYEVYNAGKTIIGWL